MRVISLVSFTNGDALQFSRKQGKPSSFPLSASVSAAHCIFRVSQSIRMKAYLTCCKLFTAVSYLEQSDFFQLFFFIWLVKGGSQLHRQELFLCLHIKSSVSALIFVWFAESTDTFWYIFLKRSFYDNLFQLLSHSGWSFVEDFLFLLSGSYSRF